MIKTRHVGKKVVILMVLCSFSLTAAGCEPLRKKFIRQKKKDKEANSAAAPILEPIDYPRSSYSVEKDFAYRYSMWNIWYKEYKTVVYSIQHRKADSTQKKEVSIINQLISQVEEMDELVTDQKRVELAKIKEDLNKILEAVHAPDAFRDSLSIGRDLYQIDKEFRSRFNPDNMEPYYRKQNEALH